MAVRAREIKNKRDGNGVLTGKSGTVYDVNIKYKVNGEYFTHDKRGFPTKKEAQQYEAEMRVNLNSNNVQKPDRTYSNLTMSQYLEGGIDPYATFHKLRAGTIKHYKEDIQRYINPYIGNVKLKELTTKMIDEMLAELYKKNLSDSTIKYAFCVLNVALEDATKKGHISDNPASTIETKFHIKSKVPEPYDVQLMCELMSKVAGSDWEPIIMLAGLYGFRRNEIAGLRINKIDLRSNVFQCDKQLPYDFDSQKKTIAENELAPVKSLPRDLPITEVSRPMFIRQIAEQERRKKLSMLSGKPYYDNHLFVSNRDGSPLNTKRLSINFASLLRRLKMRHIRFHDLRHTAATNMYNLTGDFYTIAKILGHTIKGDRSAACTSIIRYSSNRTLYICTFRSKGGNLENIP